MSTHKKNNRRRKSNATKLAHKKFHWLLKQVALGPRMSALAYCACMVVCDHVSLDHGGQAIIGQDTVAKKLGVRREAANRALREAVALGHLEAIRRGRDRANAYRMVLKDEAQAADDVTDSVTSKAPHDVRTERTSTPHMMCDFQPHDVRTERTDSPFSSPGAPTEPPGKKERETDANASDISSGGGSPPPFGAGPPRQDGGPAEAETEKSAVLQQQEKFGELRAVWQRGRRRCPRGGGGCRASFRASMWGGRPR